MADQDKTQAGPQTGSADDLVPGQAREPEAASSERRGTGAEVHAYIGRQLRAVYDDVAKQPIPDRFIELMKQLEMTDTTP